MSGQWVVLEEVMSGEVTWTSVFEQFFNESGKFSLIFCIS
jgi:hypothetical protein